MFKFLSLNYVDFFVKTLKLMNLDINDSIKNDLVFRNNEFKPLIVLLNNKGKKVIINCSNFSVNILKFYMYRYNIKSKVTRYLKRNANKC